MAGGFIPRRGSATHPWTREEHHVDNCIDVHAPDAEHHLQHYAGFAIESGHSAGEGAIESTGEHARTGRPGAEEAPLTDAGFSGTELCIAELSWRRWIT